MTWHAADSENTGRNDLDLKKDGKKWNAATKFEYEMCDENH